MSMMAPERLLHYNDVHDDGFNKSGWRPWWLQNVHFNDQIRQFRPKRDWLLSNTQKTHESLAFFCHIQHRWARGVSGGVDPHLFRFFYYPPKVQIDPTPSRSAFLTPSLDFGFLTGDVFFFRKFFWKCYIPKKNFAGQIFFLGNRQIMQF